MLKLEHELEEDYFYFIQIIQRKKENPGLGSINRIIRSYNISSLKKFDKNKDEIIALCNTFNARAYIHLNRRKWSSICLECLRHNAELIANEQYEGIKSSLETILLHGEDSFKKVVIFLCNKLWMLFNLQPLYHI